jgi:SAM-dependent methyltransferase
MIDADVRTCGGTTPGVTLRIEPEVLEFYTEQCDEAARLTASLRGRLEAVRVRELLSSHLPPAPARVADIGGGPGVHALWLQRQGYTVDLLDPVPRHVDAARAAGVGVGTARAGGSAVLGDARDLPWPDGIFSVALLAGPLYHLPPADRATALREAVRVVKPGGVVAAVAVNRYANLFGAAIANQLNARRQVVDDIVHYGHSPRNDRVPHMYYHSASELAAELTAAGLEHVEVYGLTGPGGWLTVALDSHYPPDRTAGRPDHPAVPETMRRPDPLQTALMAARDADAHPDLTPASAQLMAIARVPVEPAAAGGASR